MELGEAHDFPNDMVAWLRSLPKGCSPAHAYEVCSRGDWIALFLALLPLDCVSQAALKAAGRAVDRAIRNHALQCGISVVEGWGIRWLSGEDRSVEAVAKVRAYIPPVMRALKNDEAWRCAFNAWAAVDAARSFLEEDWEGALVSAVDAARYDDELQELRLQAEDLHAEVPRWPGK